MNALAPSNTVLCPPPPLVSGRWLYNDYALSWASSDVGSVTLADEHGCYVLEANAHKLLPGAPVPVDAFWKVDSMGVATLSLVVKVREDVAHEVVLAEWNGQPLPSLGPASPDDELPHLELLPSERGAVSGSWLLGDLRLCWHVYAPDCVAAFSGGHGTVLQPGGPWVQLKTPVPTWLRLEVADERPVAALALKLTPKSGPSFTTYLAGWSLPGPGVLPWWPRAERNPLNPCACERWDRS